MARTPSLDRGAPDAGGTFLANRPVARPRDQRDLMERPFFSLAKTPRVKPILYISGTTEVRVHAAAEVGIATVWDADILIWATSQIAAAENLGLPTSPRLRFAPFLLLRSIGRDTSRRRYRLLKAALRRLQGTRVATTLRHGADWEQRSFRWIDEWEERIGQSGRSAGIELVLSDWLYAGAVDRTRLLTVHPDYFRLTGGIERWLYRVARKHAGRQPQGWCFELGHLHLKSGAQGRFADFVSDLRRLVLRQSLPGYRLALAFEARRTLLEIVPTGPVDNVEGPLGTSAPIRLGTSAPSPSGHRRRDRSLTHGPTTTISPRNLESNLESNGAAGAGPSAKPHSGAGGAS